MYGLATFQPLVEVLCQEYRAVFVDPVGVGRSDPLPDRPYFRRAGRGLRAVIEAIGGRAVVVIGLSAGGNLAVNLAARYPHLVEKLVIIGTHASASLAPDYPVPVADTDRQWRLESAQARPGGRLRPGDRHLPGQGVLRAGDASPPGEKRPPLAGDAAASPSQFSRRSSIPTSTSVPAADPEAPQLILQGAEDRLVPAACRWIAEQIPGSKLYLFEGQGHMPQFRAPADWSGARYLATLERPKSRATAGLVQDW